MKVEDMRAKLQSIHNFKYEKIKAENTVLDIMHVLYDHMIM